MFVSHTTINTDIITLCGEVALLSPGKVICIRITWNVVGQIKVLFERDKPPEKHTQCRHCHQHHNNLQTDISESIEEKKLGSLSFHLTNMSHCYCNPSIVKASKIFHIQKFCFNSLTQILACMQVTHISLLPDDRHPTCAQ